MSNGFNERRLFVGNYDDGIQLKVLNIDDAFVGYTTGELARKCEEVAPRATHMLGEHEAALLYAPLPAGFADYYADLYGHAPRVFHPKRRVKSPDEPLSLLQFALEDSELLAALSAQGRELGWKLSPFIGHPLVFDLAGRLGLPVAGIDEERVRAGLVVELNDKALFQKACRELGIPVPSSLHVLGWEELVEATTRFFERDGKVFLRRSRAAGGLGNCKITQDRIAESGEQSLREHLERTLHPHDEWVSEIVLVEPVLDVISSPSVLAHVTGDTFTIAATIDQVIKDDAYIGGDFPTKETPRVKDLLEQWMGRYLEGHFIPLGGQGWVDIDFGRLSDGSFVAFESNARVTGNNHGLSVRHRLLNSTADRTQAWTNDALKVASGTTLQQVLDAVGRDNLWNPERGDGVVISIPPAGDAHHFSMGYVALASTLVRKLALRDAMDDFARRTW